ncbi:MAG TPA: division plane positioning ATPase MipZ [Sphingobium sp.]|uniref:KGGVGR-motif variant AAA ATPase n=1 Tax=Sphingobium sp. TaxID=1912891 RepID=UPI002ED094C8
MARVTTFYSYKGGSGRSMTMANVAWALATNGERVLAIDWDLEAPGLHRYFHPFLSDPEQTISEGLIDRIWTYIEQLGSAARPGRDRSTRFALTACDDIVQPLELPTRSKGCLHLLGAGRQDDQYSDKVGGLDWANFYARFDGETFIERLIDWARGRYSHILIDSRTGVADTAGICTAQLPDAVVMCVVYNRQSIEGSAAIARSIVKARVERGQRPLNIRFIPCRVEERGVVEAARRFASARLGDALDHRRGTIERQLRRDEVRHYPWCAFEEKLAVFEDVPDERGSLLDAMHELAAQITDRKKLRIENIDAKLLETIWRRAAFDDPRMADLLALEEVSLDTAYSQIVTWVDAALDDREERPDWLIALGEAAVAFAGRADDRHSTRAVDFLGRSGLKIANRAMDADAQQYTVRFALLLQSRAGQLQKLGEYDEARELATHSYHLLLHDDASTSRWRAARSLERVAEISLAQDSYDQSLVLYREVARLYGSIGRRDLPLGAALDPARSLRVLAEQLLAHGDPHEADHVAGQAVRMLGRLGKPFSQRDAGEIVNILATRAEIAAFVDADTAEREIMKVRLHAREKITSPTALNQLEQRLCMAEARMRMHRGDYPSALHLLERASQLDTGSGHPAPDIPELRAKILLDTGREREAANVMLEALRVGKATPNAEFIELLQRSLTAAGQEEAFNAEMLELLMEGDDRQPLFKTAVNWLVAQQSKRVDSDSQSPPSPPSIIRNLALTHRLLDKKTGQE